MSVCHGCGRFNGEGNPDANHCSDCPPWRCEDWWIKARWLGLRRPIYYWALHSVVAKWKRRAPVPRESKG